MEKALIASLFLAGVFSVPLGAMADAPWFDRYDHNHDGHWSYSEFRRAHYEWWKAHHEGPRLSDRELRREFDAMSSAHPGWVEREQVRGFHHWD